MTLAAPASFPKRRATAPGATLRIRSSTTMEIGPTYFSGTATMRARLLPAKESGANRPLAMWRFYWEDRRMRSSCEMRIRQNRRALLISGILGTSRRSPIAWELGCSPDRPAHAAWSIS